MKSYLPDDCLVCGRRMNRDKHPVPGLPRHSGSGQCIDCRQRTPHLIERLTTHGRDEETLDVAAVRARIDDLIADRRARGVPWCGTAPDPSTFKEERLEPGRHRHHGWQEAVA